MIRRRDRYPLAEVDTRYNIAKIKKKAKTSFKKSYIKENKYAEAIPLQQYMETWINWKKEVNIREWKEEMNAKYMKGLSAEFILDLLTMSM